MKFNRVTNCAICGGVEAGKVAQVCPGCGGRPGHADLRPLRSKGWGFAMIVVGFLVMIPAFFAWVYLYGHDLGYIHLYIGFTLCILAAVFGRYSAASDSSAAFLISLPYVLIMGNYLRSELSYEHNYLFYGSHWAREFFMIPALTYIAPPVLAYLGARSGSHRSVLPVLTAAALFVLLLTGVISMGPSKIYAELSDGVSFGVADNDKIQLRVSVECRFRKWKHYWEFRDLSEGGCSQMTLTIERKIRDLKLPETIEWTIDGKEVSRPVHQNPVPEGLLPPSDAFFTITTWRTEIPFSEMKNAKEVKFRWGPTQMDFTDPEANRVKQIDEVLTQLAAR